jgi:multimeric flavodoxin WrbA
MKVMAFNGSPRKEKWNTVTLLQHALMGAEKAGADTELVQLYDLKFSGCLSCFSCKKISRKEDGVCVLKDDLTPVLDRIRKEADALVIGTPVYYGCESAATRAFLERLCFPYLKYSSTIPSLFPGKINTAVIYTMNVSEEISGQMGYDHLFGTAKRVLEKHFGRCEIFLATDTLQYDDYSQFESEIFDSKAKVSRHVEIFPKDCHRAFDLGKRMASMTVPVSN